MTILRIRFVLIPRLLASSSPNERTLSCQRTRKRIKKPAPIGIKMLNSFALFMTLKLPISQKVICGSLLSASAKILMVDVPDWNRVLTIIPPSTNPRIGSMLNRRVAVAAMNTAKIPPQKLNIWTYTVGSSINIAKQAPNPAPAEAPKISGDTIGFLNIP